MTVTFARPGPVRRQLPYAYVEWLCVEPCGSQVAITRLDLAAQKVETWPSQFQPVRWPAADRDGLPYYGPSRREMRGKSTRRHPAKIAAAAYSRMIERLPATIGSAWDDAETADRLSNDPEFTIPSDSPDYRPIEAEEFDTVCMKCATRLRIRLATAIADGVSS